MLLLLGGAGGLAGAEIVERSLLYTLNDPNNTQCEVGAVVLLSFRLRSVCLSTVSGCLSLSVRLPWDCELNIFSTTVAYTGLHRL